MPQCFAVSGGQRLASLQEATGGAAVSATTDGCDRSGRRRTQLAARLCAVIAISSALLLVLVPAGSSQAAPSAASVRSDESSVSSSTSIAANVPDAAAAKPTCVVAFLVAVSLFECHFLGYGFSRPYFCGIGGGVDVGLPLTPVLGTLVETSSETPETTSFFYGSVAAGFTMIYFKHVVVPHGRFFGGALTAFAVGGGTASWYQSLPGGRCSFV